jgi:hypothetical protein
MLSEEQKLRGKELIRGLSYILKHEEIAAARLVFTQSVKTPDIKGAMYRLGNDWVHIPWEQGVWMYEVQHLILSKDVQQLPAARIVQMRHGHKVLRIGVCAAESVKKMRVQINKPRRGIGKVTRTRLKRMESCFAKGADVETAIKYVIEKERPPIESVKPVRIACLALLKKYSVKGANLHKTGNSN